jgi:hypothetical protein
MITSTGSIERKAAQLQEALAVYGQFIEGWPYDSEPIPAPVDTFLSTREIDRAVSPGVALATAIREQYHEARELEATYIDQYRDRKRPDWHAFIDETEPLRKAARRVHTAGYEVDSTGESTYRIPPEMCPAHLVSMNANSSPVTFEDRVLQYRAFADRFDVSPDVVQYPGSGHDVSPSDGFPQSRVRYIDVDAAAMADLEQAGYEAVAADAVGYEASECADVIVFRNAGLAEEPIVHRNLRPGGWVLANNHLESAEHLLAMDALDLVGVVPNTWSGDEPAVDTTAVDAYLSPIETDAEYRTWRRDEYRAGDARPAFKKGSHLDLYVFSHSS